MLRAQRSEVISHLSHPVLLALQALQTGTLVVTFPEGTELMYGGLNSGTQAEMQINDWDVLDDIANYGDIGFGEGYMLGMWDTHNLQNLMRLFAENIDAVESYIDGSIFFKTLYSLKNKLRSNTYMGSRKNIQAHYDLGNDFYKLWLDKTLTYSGGLFNGNPATSLEDAQKAKYQRILDRLSPLPTDHILEIGCGWGGFMEIAAKNGHRVTGVTISQPQAELATIRLAKADVDHLTEVHLQDYREVTEAYDHVVSIGMLEHVGEKFWTAYMEKIYNTLKPSGKAVIQTIVVREDLYKKYRKNSDFIREHIFPGGMLPSPARFKDEATGAGFRINDVFFFGRDYAITLEKWLEKFDGHIQNIRDMDYSEEFIRKWRLYLAMSAAMFRAGRIDLMQVELGRID
jgi:cyclopropane-fatty-acyl-phospholipid synthase